MDFFGEKCYSVVSPTPLQGEGKAGHINCLDGSQSQQIRSANPVIL